MWHCQFKHKWATVFLFGNLSAKRSPSKTKPPNCSSIWAWNGEQRILELGLALATQPKLLLLDEPMAGAGPVESERILNLILKLRERAAILLIEHDMDAVFRLADRISVLVSGAVIATGTPSEIRHHPQVIAAYLGEENA